MTLQPGPAAKFTQQTLNVLIPQEPAMAKIGRGLNPRLFKELAIRVAHEKRHIVLAKSRTPHLAQDLARGVFSRRFPAFSIVRSNTSLVNQAARVFCGLRFGNTFLLAGCSILGAAALAYGIYRIYRAPGLPQLPEARLPSKIKEGQTSLPGLSHSPTLDKIPLGDARVRRQPVGDNLSLQQGLKKHMHIRPEETEIVGGTAKQGKVLVPDDTWKRIDFLTGGVLKEVKDLGWSTLYRDPKDGRYWEKTYPDSESHGGGAPKLTHISPQEAAKRYGPLSP